MIKMLDEIVRQVGGERELRSMNILALLIGFFVLESNNVPKILLEEGNK